jgi:hypothetical protein
MTDTAEQILARGVKEREALRETRLSNYQVKAANNFKCEKCSATQSILVVRDGERLTTRCELHRDGLRATPGQWAS